MTLQVPFESFTATLRRRLHGDEVFLRTYVGTTLATASTPETEFVLASRTSLSLADARKRLESEGLRVFDGGWLVLDELEADVVTADHIYVAAVAYLAEGGRPGLWVDAWDYAPTEVQAIQALVEELNVDGEAEGLTYEHFVATAHPTVVVVPPGQIQDFIRQKEG